MALVLKVVWKMAQGSKAPWAETLKAKYCPYTGFWPIVRTYSCTLFWRSLVSLKPLLISHLLWKIGPGDRIDAFGQPWFQGWENFRATSSRQRNLQVSMLISQHSQNWDFDELQADFGFQQALIISLTVSIGSNGTSNPDTLLFTAAKTGRFTVKGAYKMLKGDVGTEADKDYWKAIWNFKGLTPKLKLFIWRCTSNALPVQGVIGARIGGVPSVCQLCKQAPETVEHMLFHYDFSRAAWLASPLTLRSHNLNGQFREVMISMISTLQEMNLVRFICMCWAIWRVRNDAILGHKRQTMFACLRYYEEILLVCQMGFGAQETQTVPLPYSGTILHNPLTSSEDPICYVDGSWSSDGLAGIGAYVFVNGRVVQWCSQGVQAMSSAQAEAMAVVIGYKMLISYVSPRCLLYSDSMETVDSLAHKQPRVHDWRMFAEVWTA